MKDSEFNALISLLEDDDPTVFEHVEGRLIAMGQEVIPRLEEAWEHTGYPIIQSRIEEIIHFIQTQDITQNLLAWRKAGGSSLLEGWFLVSQYQFPEIQLSKYEGIIKRLAHRAFIDIRSQSYMTTRQKLSTISQLLFRKEKFKSNIEEVFHPDNYYLNRFLETKKGGPITFGMLYLLICEKLEIHLRGVILPNYFLLYYKDRHEEFYIDIFGQGNFITKQDIEGFLRQHKVEIRSSYFRPTSKIYMILELIRLFIYSYEQENKPAKVKSFKRLQEGIKIDFT